MSQIYKSGVSGPIGPNIEKIDGDTGYIDANEVTIYANNAGLNAGSSVSFDANIAHTIMTLNVTDSNSNTIIGKNSGKGAISSVQNTVLGASSGSSLTSGTGVNTLIGYSNGPLITTGSNTSSLGAGNLSLLTTGTDNTALGTTTLTAIDIGSFNIAIGSHSGIGLSGGDSSNILINHIGVGGQSNTIRIGTQGPGSDQQNKCFIAGIVTNTVSNQQIVTINSSTGQLGVTTGSSNVAFLAYLGTNDINATGDGTQYTIGTQHPLTIVYNDGGGLATNGTFTVPSGAAGVYQFQCFIRYTNLLDTHTTGYVVLIVNASPQYNLTGSNPYVIQSQFASGGADYDGGISLKLSALDTVKMQAFVAGGTPTVTVLAGSASSFVTYFTGVKIG
jgi:hypothetical protein